MRKQLELTERQRRKAEIEEDARRLVDETLANIGKRMADVLAGREVPKDNLTNTVMKVMAAAGLGCGVGAAS
jgi:hypothetical protein